MSLFAFVFVCLFFIVVIAVVVCQNRVKGRQIVSLYNTVNPLISGHPRELKKVSVSRAVRLRELFPLADIKEK